MRSERESQDCKRVKQGGNRCCCQIGKHGERRGFGWKEKEFSCGHIEFQVVMGHPSRNVRQTIGDVVLDGRETG